tara:strand:- start:522 stop:1052 length:531 start_codon:yes stop_codon:yes gene_type:complete
MSITLPTLTDKQFSSYNDVNKMRRIINDFFDRVLLTKKATHRNVSSGDLKHMIEDWAHLKRDGNQKPKYPGNTYILEPFLVKVAHEKNVPLKEIKLSETNILFSRCYVGVSKRSIDKLDCFNHQATPDDDFKVKPYEWHRHGPLLNHHIKRLAEIGYDDIWKANDWKKIYYGKAAW